MSEYSARVGAERVRNSESGASVGDALDVSQVYTTSHPLYKEYSEKLRGHVAKILARETAKRTTAQQAVCTVTVDAETKADMTRDYPEFRIIWPQWTMPVHAEWIAQRQLASQYMVHHMRRYATSFAVYGAGALPMLTLGVEDASLYVDTTMTTAVHESYDDDVATARLITYRASAATHLGWETSTEQVDKYRAGEYLRKSCGPKRAPAGALIVDGGLYAMAPLQFMFAMIDHKADVGMYALPYHPSMLVHGTGNLVGTSVQFEIDEQSVVFKYPEGVAGVSRYSSGVWHQWLCNTVRSLQGIVGRSYQFELLGTRGSFMLIRVVKVDAPAQTGVEYVHSLQLEEAQDYTLVRTWRLRSLAANVYDSNSWERVQVTVPTRVVEKTHDFAMSLPPEQFSMHAIRKRLSVVNDRVIVQGTAVHVNSAMCSDDLDVLEIALFTHCFVARYEAGRLSAAMRRVVDTYASFGTLGFFSKLACVLTTCASLAYDWTLGVVDQVLRDAFDAARRWLGGLAPLRTTEFAPAPQFIQYRTLLRRVSRNTRSAIQGVMTQTIASRDLQVKLPGFKYLALMNDIQRGDSPSYPLLDNDYEVRSNGADIFSDVVDTSTRATETTLSRALVGKMREVNDFGEDDGSRHFMTNAYSSAGVAEVDIDRDDYSYDPGYLETLDDFHESVIPGLRNVDFKYDPTSIATDDQNRYLAAEYLDLPLDFGEMPKEMNVYASRLQAYNVTKRPSTLHETLSAFHARALSAPVLSLPQDDVNLIEAMFNDFLDIACVPEARSMLAGYQTDPVSLEERAMMDWVGRSRPENVLKVYKHMVDNPEAWEELRLGRYESMIKTDVKPPLSDKPLHSRVEPQVIVYHMTAVNAIFSSIFRVLVRRFLSLLKPNFMLNLLKDMPQVRDLIQVHHDWNTKLSYLENDFSKYDKSQGHFALELEIYIFTRLGMNKEMLSAWGLGHVESSIRSVTTGLSLSVRYQRKSGDATTAFGNGILNMVSVLHAYKGTDIVWAVFMGDDSLVAARTIIGAETAVQALAEKFNLQAKFYITQAPYFASNFVLLHTDERRVTCVPDPVKRVEKWSMAVPAIDPKWDERYQSALNNLTVYRQRSNLVGLGRALYERYSTHGGIDFDHVGDAIASAIRSFKDFRAIWEAEPMRLIF